MSEASKLFFGDNLKVLRDEIPDESIDLIYLDPPFKSNATYNVLFKAPSGDASEAQVEAFEDTWHWGLQAEESFDEVMVFGNTDVAELLRTMRAFLKENDMMAYLAMMAIRLLELHLTLKVSGSIYLHCDPTASHYLKLLLDAVFGHSNFRNEIIWRRTASNKSQIRFGPIHQIIFFYSKSGAVTFNKLYLPYTKDYIKQYFDKKDQRGRYRPVLLTGPGTRSGPSGQPWDGYNPTSSGRHWQPASYLYKKYEDITGEDLAQYPLLERLGRLDEVGLIYRGGKRSKVPNYKFYLNDAPGIPMQDIWAYQPGTKGCLYDLEKVGIDQDVRWLMANDAERLGYPTQKPVGLLERIILASSNPGDVVLDPFCGCGTSIHAAEKLERRWVGIDITHLAIGLIEWRMKKAFPKAEYEVFGQPKDLDGAKDLAQRDKYQFQWWAVWLAGAVPYGGKKKGADKGIDGIIYFKPDYRNTEKAIVSVKGGANVSVSMIRELKAVVEQQKAKIGIFVTLTKPTKPMLKEAHSSGFYEARYGKYPKIQILTIEEMFGGKRPNIPVVDPTVALKEATSVSTEEQKKLYF